MLYLPLSSESSCLSWSSYAFSDAITNWYSHSSDCEKAMKWIPCMAGYLTSAAYSSSIMITDLFIATVTGLTALFSGFQCAKINTTSGIFWSSVYYDLQVLSIGVVGTIVPTCAVLLRLAYRVRDRFLYTPIGIGAFTRACYQNQSRRELNVIPNARIEITGATIPRVAEDTSRVVQGAWSLITEQVIPSVTEGVATKLQRAWSLITEDAIPNVVESVIGRAWDTWMFMTEEDDLFIDEAEEISAANSAVVEVQDEEVTLSTAERNAIPDAPDYVVIDIQDVAEEAARSMTERNAVPDTPDYVVIDMPCDDRMHFPEETSPSLVESVQRNWRQVRTGLHNMWDRTRAWKDSDSSQNSYV